MSKIGEWFIYKWLLDSIEDRIDRNQFGVLKKLCTTDALMLMIHKLFQALDAWNWIISLSIIRFF
jgi:hypothetical protein